jgi:RNase H-like domain found in reverse transcriptase
MAMEKLKMFVKDSPAIKAIDYGSDREVTLAVDSSWIAVGFILSQQGEDGKRYPSRFGSITWNETEQRYSQAKLELYGLFRALKAVKMYIVGLKNFVVEVDAKYIKGMINNPDVQPTAAINRWIAGILLFNFQLRHVSAKDHAPADGLSRRPRSQEDPDDLDDVDDCIDNAYSFGVVCLNDIREYLPIKDPASHPDQNGRSVI